MIIYSATNNLNGKVYVGLTTKTLDERINCHLSETKKDRLSHLYFYRALKKYGADNFTWKILCETDTKEKLKALEKFYIMAYCKIGKIYNMTNGGELRLNSISIETRKKLSEIRKGVKLSEETKKKLRIANLGKKSSEQTKEKMRQSMIGKNTGKRNPEIIDKIRNAIISNGGYHANSGSFKNGMSPWNKGLKSNIDQSGNKNPCYRHDVSNNKIQELLANGLSVKEISVIMQCNDRTVYRRINKMRLI